MLFIVARKLPIIRRYLLLCTLAWWILWFQGLKGPLFSLIKEGLLFTRQSLKLPQLWTAISSGEGLSLWSEPKRGVDEEGSPMVGKELLQSRGMLYISAIVLLTLYRNLSIHHSSPPERIESLRSGIIFYLFLYKSMLNGGAAVAL